MGKVGVLGGEAGCVVGREFSWAWDAGVTPRVGHARELGDGI